MAKRLENVLPKLIHLDQTGFIRQRQTQGNIRRTLHILWHIQHYKIESMFLGLDAEKAFDTVRWLYLYKVLEKFGFDINIIKAFQAYTINQQLELKLMEFVTRIYSRKIL